MQKLVRMINQSTWTCPAIQELHIARDCITASDIGTATRQEGFGLQAPLIRETDAYGST